VIQVDAVILLGTLAGAVPALDTLAPPPGMRELFEVTASGVQIYVCEEKGQERGKKGFGWAFVAPEAVLFDTGGKRVGMHSKGPTWTLDDGSSVIGELAAKQPSSNKGSVPWLLLRVTSHQGAGRLDGASFIRRVNTSGGAEPEGGCDGAHKGNTARVPYTAAYQFFGPEVSKQISPRPSP
jgi:hypothetical protein